MERVRNANGTRSERVTDAFGMQMERERSVRLFLSSTVGQMFLLGCTVVLRSHPSLCFVGMVFI